MIENPLEIRGPSRLNAWAYLRWLRGQRFERSRDQLREYLRLATPLALTAERLYREWRDVVSEPIQEPQKAANASATYWWRITEVLRSFRQLAPPKMARKYHRLFDDALRDASFGSELAKNGFRAGKTHDVSRGLGHLDSYVAAIGKAEAELGRLLRKYRLTEG